MRVLMGSFVFLLSTLALQSVIVPPLELKFAGSFSANPFPVAIAAGDLNADEKADLVVGSALDRRSNDLVIFLGHGDGTFRRFLRIPLASRPMAVAIGDFDGDGFPDLVVTTRSPNNVLLLRNAGDGTWMASMELPLDEEPVDLVTGDFNQDGYLDVAVAISGHDPRIIVLLGNGDGTFARARDVRLPPSPLRLGTADFNKDGFLDLVVTHRTTRISVLLGRGDGTFAMGRSAEVRSPATSVVAGDFNDDGVPDLGVTLEAPDRGVAVLFGDGAGTFDRATYVSGLNDRPCCLAAGDFNADGHLDLAVSNSWKSDQLSLLAGHGDGTFTLNQVAVGYTPGAIAVADFNRDRRLDLAVCALGPRRISILLGKSASGPSH